MKEAKIISLVLLFVMLLSACQQAVTPEPEVVVEEPAEEFVFGMLLVGPYNDMGWSQAHYEAGRFVEERVPNTRMIYIDTVNTADRPGTTADQLADELVSQGARVIVFNSDDMKADAIEFTRNNPDIYVIHASGDSTWEDGENYTPFDNMINVMPWVEDMKMIAGCSAALHTETGAIAYVGPLINEETRRLVAAAHLGANYCWENYLGREPEELRFKVTWIGFWFNIPGFTEDPSEVAKDFINSDFDVLISGIDTTEALVEAHRASQEGRRVYAIPYDYIHACDEAPDACLGVPYYNWGPAYVRYIQSAMDGSWQSVFEWIEPYWSDINDLENSVVGYVNGPAVYPEAEEMLADFVTEMSQGLNLWTGPLYFQDGTQFLAEGQEATDVEIWYLPQLLLGAEGRSE